MLDSKFSCEPVRIVALSDQDVCRIAIRISDIHCNCQDFPSLQALRAASLELTWVGKDRVDSVIERDRILLVLYRRILARPISRSIIATVPYHLRIRWLMRNTTTACTSSWLIEMLSTLIRCFEDCAWLCGERIHWISLLFTAKIVECRRTTSSNWSAEFSLTVDEKILKFLHFI